ncbi:MAG: hypothetical protein LUG83_02895 [Lachnospiraceae bacterium]|nr:hypothetical protein [Lachnospiraceae bacterium]
MDNWENLLDKDIVQTNVKFAAMFILNYECLKDYVISQPCDFYCDWSIEDEKEKIVETEAYKTEVRSLAKNIEDASLCWFKEAEAISEEDICKYQIIRKRRNEIVHEFINNLNEGFGIKDIELFKDLLDLYSKIDKWWINEIEIPISGEDIPVDYNRDEVCGGQAFVLKIINDLCFDINAEEYRKILDDFKEILKKNISN